MLGLTDSIEKYTYLDYQKSIFFADELLRHGQYAKNEQIILNAIDSKITAQLYHSQYEDYLKTNTYYKSKIDSLQSINNNYINHLYNYYYSVALHNSITLGQSHKTLKIFDKADSILTNYPEYFDNYLEEKYHIHYWYCNTYNKQFKYNEAILYLNRAIDFHKEAAGIDDLRKVNDLPQEYLYLSSLYEKLGNEKLQFECLQIAEKKINNILRLYPEKSRLVAMGKKCYSTFFNYWLSKDSINLANKYLIKTEPLLSTYLDSVEYNSNLSKLKFAQKEYTMANDIIKKEISDAIKSSPYRALEFRRMLVKNYISQNNYSLGANEIEEILKVYLNNKSIFDNVPINSISYEQQLLETLELISTFLLSKNNVVTTPSSKDSIKAFAQLSFNYINHKRKLISNHDDILISLNSFNKTINNYIELFSTLEDDLNLYKTVEFAKSFSLEFAKLKNESLQRNKNQDLKYKEILLKSVINTYEYKLTNETSNLTSLQDSLLKYKKEYSNLTSKLISNDNTFDDLQFDNKSDIHYLTKDISHNESILNYYIIEDDIFIFHLTKNNIQVEKINQNNNLRRYLLEDLSNINNRKPLEFSKEMSSILLPASFQLRKKITIIPDSYLFYFPFEILIHKNEYLLLNKNISYIHSEKLIESNTISKDPNFFGIAPDFNENCVGLKPLQFNLQELNNISKLFNSPKLSIENGTIKSDFEAQIKDENIIHFATHVKLNESDSDKSYIALGGKCEDTLKTRIYLRDLISYDLKSDLVVLSGCDSGLGELVNGEGLTSLSKSLFYSNVKSVVSTLWKVNDNSTSEIMTYFYENMRKGHSKNKALKEAKLTYLSKADPDYQHPYYWSGIIAMGDMSPIFPKSKKNYIIIFIGMIFLFIIVRHYFKNKNRLAD